MILKRYPLPSGVTEWPKIIKARKAYVFLLLPVPRLSFIWVTSKYMQPIDSNLNRVVHPILRNRVDWYMLELFYALRDLVNIYGSYCTFSLTFRLVSFGLGSVFFPPAFFIFHPFLLFSFFPPSVPLLTHQKEEKEKGKEGKTTLEKKEGKKFPLQKETRRKRRKVFFQSMKWEKGTENEWGRERNKTVPKRNAAARDS